MFPPWTRALGLPAMFAACLLAAGTPPARAATPPFTAALVIGNAHYRSVGELKNPQNDANDMCAALRSIGFSTTCLVDVDTRVRMRAVMEDFVDSLPPGAVSVIYYAGHGVQIDGENYLIPTDARLTDEESVREQAVSLSFLMRQLRRHTGYLTVVILDACRNNPLATPGSPHLPGLAQITDIPEATEVVYATAANEAAVDGTGRNGTFTKNLLAHLREPGTIDDLFKAVSHGVQSDTEALGHVQRPALYTNFSGQYCLVRCTTLESLQKQQMDAQRALADLKAQVISGAPDKDPKLRAVHKAKRHPSSFVPPAL